MKLAGIIFEIVRKLFVIRFPGNDLHCPVYLFGNDDPGHLMGESHRGETQPHICAVCHFFGDAVAASYNKYEVGSA